VLGQALPFPPKTLQKQVSLAEPEKFEDDDAEDDSDHQFAKQKFVATENHVEQQQPKKKPAFSDDEATESDDDDDHHHHPLAEIYSRRDDNAPSVLASSRGGEPPSCTPSLLLFITEWLENLTVCVEFSLKVSHLKDWMTDNSISIYFFQSSTFFIKIYGGDDT